MPQANPIVLEKLLRLARSSGVRRGVLAAVLPFVGVVAAFGIAPDTVTEKVVVAQRCRRRCACRRSPTASSDDETYWREERIQRGDTIASLLARLRVEDADACASCARALKRKGLRQLVPGRIVRAHTTEDGRLIELRYSNAGSWSSIVKADGDGFRVAEQVAPLERRVVMKSAEITQLAVRRDRCRAT